MRLTILVLGAALGALVVLSLFSASTHVDKPSFKSVIHPTTPTKFIPAQTLNLIDAGGRPIGDLQVTACRAHYHKTSCEEGGDITLHLASASRSPFWLDTAAYLYIHADSSEWTLELYPRSGYDVERLMASAGQLTYVGKEYQPLKAAETHEYRYSLDSELPTQDIALTTREGKSFAVLGLDEGGIPTIALLSADDGLLRAELKFRSYPCNSLETLEVFDGLAGLRAQVNYRPQAPPALEVMAFPFPLSFILDRTKGRFVQTEQVPLPVCSSQTTRADTPWITDAFSKPKFPIRLVDQRDQEIWKAP